MHSKKADEEMKNTKLEAARLNKCMTQEQLTATVGISLRAYKIYEAGERLPRADVAIRIARALDSSVEELFDEVNHEAT